MNLCFRLRLFLACLLLPATSLAMESLPRADLASVNAAISAPLQGLLDDYVTLLPTQTSLSIMGDDFVNRSWSTNRDTFFRACQADPSVCVPVLKAQFDTLYKDLRNKNPKSLLALSDAVEMSAITDLCQLAFPLDMGNRCDARQDLAALASIAWHNLGYDHLFLAYQDLDFIEREQKRKWLEYEAKLTTEETERGLKRLERDKGADARDAYAFELRKLPSASYSSWLNMLLQQGTQSDQKGMLLPTVNLARLSALQNQIERAEEWWQFGQTLITEDSALKDSSQCLLQSQRFFIDVELAQRNGSIFDAPQRVQSLIDQNCPFTAQSLHYALQTVIAGQKIAPALETLKRAQAACERIDCRAYNRKEQIEALIAIAQGELATLQRAAEHWLNRLKHEMLLSTEIQLAWALAERLRNTGASAEAAMLYQALDEQIEISRNQLTGSNPTDLARYDELKRMRVRINVERGNQVNPQETESLRGQSLLQRLRSQRWHKELASEDDAEAKAELDRQLATIEAAQQNIRQLSTNVLSTVLFSEFEDFKNIARNQYLNKLAAKKQKITGNRFREPSALLSYASSENYDFQSSPLNALDSSEAYLSWLRVPGGYVGTLLAVTPRDLINNRADSSWHSIRQKFIPFTAQDEALLQLYRDLLQSGASISRGSKITLSIETDKAGLMLNGLAIWQQGDGSFITSQTAPSGGRRVKTFGNLSDALFERLLAPFAEQYQDAQRLIISPDGALAYLPFETLTRQGVPVLETVDISYIQSLAVYAELKKRSSAKKRKSEPSLLSVADPLYTPSASASATASVSGGTESKSLRGLVALSWPALPGTRKEAAAITRLYRNNRQLLGPKASKESLYKLQKEKKLKDFQILHFATHGYVDDERSALVLSSGRTPLSGYLLDEEIVGWDLDSDLVLLSACNTGVGRQQQGEGVVGLPYAFFMAGNINTLMSLWPVDDAGTAALIPAFMERIQRGEDHVTALNNTKRAFARGDYGPELRNPRVWSAFVLYGIPLSRP